MKTLRRTECERDGCAGFLMKLIESSEQLCLNSCLRLGNCLVLICTFQYLRVFTDSCLLIRGFLCVTFGNFSPLNDISSDL